MSHYRRYFVPGGSFFFTVVTYQRRPFLVDALARQCLREAIQLVVQNRPVEIVAIVLLPDHLHTIWSLPPGDFGYSIRWRRIKEEFTNAFLNAGGWEGELSDSRRKRKERGVWQRRFWEHTLRDEDDFERHFDYIHYNPAKHGLVQHVRDWPHSSFHRWVKAGVYSQDWGSAAPSFADLDETAME